MATRPHPSSGGTGHLAIAPILPRRLARALSATAGRCGSVSPIGKPNSPISLIERDVELTQDGRTDITHARAVEHVDEHQFRLFECVAADPGIAVEGGRENIERAVDCTGVTDYGRFAL